MFLFALVCAGIFITQGVLLAQDLSNDQIIFVEARLADGAKS